MIHSVPTIFQNHGSADATSLLTCIQLVDLIMVMHCLSFPAFPAVAVEYLSTSQDNKICSFCHLYIVATVSDVSVRLKYF